jgi:catechol 2,3-dioxygenase-like lactoylglutathione lyase family enzyme/DNA-binding CsgD family transcriptional regulator
MSRRAPPGRPPHPDVLTPAEWRTVEAVRHGLTNRAIARRDGISLDAVKFHVANALAKLGLGDRRALRRWPGVARGTALSRQESAMTPAPAPALGPIGQVARHVRDVAASVAWYRDVLGLPHLYTYGTLAFFDCGGLRLFLTESAEPPGDSVLYFRVADIRAAHAALAARGVEFVSAPHRIHVHGDGTEEWMAFFNDPDGRPLGLMAQVRP